MSKNKDGFEPGQLVDSETAQRIERQRMKKAKESGPEKPKSEPKRTARKSEE